MKKHRVSFMQRDAEILQEPHTESHKADVRDGSSVGERCAPSLNGTRRGCTSSLRLQREKIQDPFTRKTQCTGSGRDFLAQLQEPRETGGTYLGGHRKLSL